MTQENFGSLPVIHKPIAAEVIVTLSTCAKMWPWAWELSGALEMSCYVVVQGFWRVTWSPLSAPISGHSLEVTFLFFTKHMHLQPDLTRDDCKSLPRANFTLPPSLPSVSLHFCQCPPSWLFVLRRALCVNELLQHMVNTPHFICYSSHWRVQPHVPPAARGKCWPCSCQVVLLICLSASSFMVVCRHC